jgi:hypothetical protein
LELSLLSACSDWKLEVEMTWICSTLVGKGGVETGAHVNQVGLLHQETRDVRGYPFYKALLQNRMKRRMRLGSWTFGLKSQRPKILELRTWSMGRSAAKGIEEMEKEIGRGRRKGSKEGSVSLSGEMRNPHFLYLKSLNVFPFYAIQTNAHTNNQRELMYLLF